MGHTAPRALFALTFVTGVVDATSFIALGGVFSAMMTGNVVFLGLGLSDSVESSVAGPLIAIAAYLVASAAAALLARRGAGPAFGTRASNTVEVGLLSAATCVAIATTLDADGASGYVTLALLAAAMSWRTTNVRALGSVNVPTAVLNLTLVAGPGTAPCRRSSGRRRGRARRGTSSRRRAGLSQGSCRSDGWAAP